MERNILVVDPAPGRAEFWHQHLDCEPGDWHLHGLSDSVEAVLPSRVDAIVFSPSLDHNEILAVCADLKVFAPDAVRIVTVEPQQSLPEIAIFEHVHQIVTLENDTLRQRLRRSFEFRSVLKKGGAETVTAGLDALPSIPQVYYDFVKATQTEGIEFGVVAEIIEQDISLTARVLQVVNSAFFSLPEDVGSIKHAISVLGMDMLRALVSATCLLRTLASAEDVNALQKIWLHGRSVSELAVAIGGQHRRLTRQQTAEIAQAALLHDIGKLIILRFVPQVAAIMQESSHKSADVRLALETELLGTTHAEIGAFLLSLWGISETTVRAVALHHRADAVAAAQCPVGTPVFLANCMQESPVPGNFEQLRSRVSDLGLDDVFGKEEVARWTFEAGNHLFGNECGG
ncbi:MAG: HDOD domain-containing protein [Pseudomonadota bacterium]